MAKAKRTRVAAITAFSLVELLVVIGIIGILVAMLLPVVPRARMLADQVHCQSNLHQIGVALFAYAASRSGELPAYSGWQIYPDGKAPPRITPPDDPGLGWTEELIPFAGATPDSKLYSCPAFPVQAKINYFLESRYLGVANPVRHSLKLSEVRLSSQYLIAGECTAGFYYPAPVGTDLYIQSDDCDKDDATQNALLFKNIDGGINMHPQRNNVLYADGHVNVLDHFDPALLTFHPQQAGVHWSVLQPVAPSTQP